MCRENHDLPSMLPYSSMDRDSAFRLLADERFNRMLQAQNRKSHSERRAKK